MPTVGKDFRNPDLFPAFYAQSALDAQSHQGRWLHFCYHKQRANVAAELQNWRYWRHELRRHGSGRGWEVEHNWRLKSKIIFNPVVGEYEALVSIRETIRSSAEIMARQCGIAP